jgi:hypothetical protein
MIIGSIALGLELVVLVWREAGNLYVTPDGRKVIVAAERPERWARQPGAQRALSVRPARR